MYFNWTIEKFLAASAIPIQISKLHILHTSGSKRKYYFFVLAALESKDKDLYMLLL